MNACRWVWRIGTLAIVGGILAGCDAKPEHLQQRYERWQGQGDADDIDDYLAFLNAHGVGDVVPASELLRSGRHWQRCGMAEFSLPPREQWDAMVPTLQLVAELRDAGLLQGATAVSVFRNPAFNACEGGSTRSRHLLNAAIDFDLGGVANHVERLCTFWRLEGPRLHFGLGFYDARRIHVDSNGHRTWGGDYSSSSSLCSKAAKER